MLVNSAFNSICTGLVLLISTPLLTAYPQYEVPLAYEKIAIEHGVPRRILYAVALVESRRRSRPWPWTLNISGKPYYFESKQSALKRLKTETEAGNVDIAIGIMQIYWRYHRSEFSQVDSLMDPQVNVSYGAKYLRSLYEQSGSWFSAVGHYYTGPNPRTKALEDKAKNYAYKVVKQWRNMR